MTNYRPIPGSMTPAELEQQLTPTEVKEFVENVKFIAEAHRETTYENIRYRQTSDGLVGFVLGLTTGALIGSVLQLFVR